MGKVKLRTLLLHPCCILALGSVCKERLLSGSRNPPATAWMLTAIRAGTLVGLAEGVSEAKRWVHLTQVGTAMAWCRS